MSLPSNLLEAFGGAGFMFGAGLLASALALLLKRYLAGRERTVSLRFPSGQRIRLDLDERLSTDQANDLVVRAVESAKAGDDKALRAAIEDSHLASANARAARR